MDKLITQAETIIKNHQLRLTKQRRSLIDLLVHQPDHYLDITMVDRLMRDMYPGISHNTIYRNLEEFEEIGLVEITQRSNCKAVKFSCEDGAHIYYTVCPGVGGPRLGGDQRGGQQDDQHQ